ncbi:theg spermatid protein [Morone saxatilis]|uniref:theg spermatid protein n=1 Tax=Morone saxatilis TaxID=34816 RepID=UPI0015E222E3|nr:theg spermatid protein [Morone saxatilis]
MATRTERLAQPKPNRLRYPDRRSVYWLDDLPLEKTGSTTKTDLPPYGSVVNVLLGQLRPIGCAVLLNLAPCSSAGSRPPTIGGLMITRTLFPVGTVCECLLNRATQTAVATSRICQLAQPKRKQVLEGSGNRSKPVPLTHMPCKASAHIELLATPKQDHPKFEGERSVCWLVSRSARNYVANQRLLELSSPKERKALFEGYDPYIVSRAARSASPSPRIQQLCLPLPRKCSSN